MNNNEKWGYKKSIDKEIFSLSKKQVLCLFSLTLLPSPFPFHPKPLSRCRTICGGVMNGVRPLHHRLSALRRPAARRFGLATDLWFCFSLGSCSFFAFFSLFSFDVFLGCWICVFLPPPSFSDFLFGFLCFSLLDLCYLPTPFFVCSCCSTCSVEGHFSATFCVFWLFFLLRFIFYFFFFSFCDMLWWWCRIWFW
jgi:hypothetical protein